MESCVGGFGNRAMSAAVSVRAWVSGTWHVGQPLWVRCVSFSCAWHIVHADGRPVYQLYPAVVSWLSWQSTV